MCGSLPVLSVYMVFFMLYDNIIMSCRFSCFCLIHLLPWQVLLVLWIEKLSLSHNALLLCLYIFRGKFSDIIGVDLCPHEIISLSDGFGPHDFCQKTCHCMKVSDGWFNAWYLIYVVGVCP